ncbi:MAG TPA: S1/P1 nuclease [Silvibacterium sp.]|nr:S1/P1 nuclease [Silvibacterium sp.]
MNAKFYAGLRRFAVLALLPLLAVPPLFGWGDKGHRMINRLAAENLPLDVPSFLRNREATEEIEYLGPEPDRWRSPAEPELSAEQAPDHFINFEFADMIGPLPRRRYDYIARLTAAEMTHRYIAQELQPDKVGFQPYITNEVWERLKAAMRNYRELTAKHANTRAVKATVIFYAGWLGHYVADGSQPLHVSRDYDGWLEKENPNGYTTEHGIHSKFETTFVNANLSAADVRPLISAVHPVSDEWSAYLTYLRKSGSMTERVYQLDKEHGLDGAGTAESRQFTAERLAAGASMLRDLIYSAWLESAKPEPQRQGPAKDGQGY